MGSASEMPPSPPLTEKEMRTCYQLCKEEPEDSTSVQIPPAVIRRLLDEVVARRVGLPVGEAGRRGHGHVNEELRDRVERERADEPPSSATWPEMGMYGERCGDCGEWCDVVRPGKTQCNNPDCPGNSDPAPPQGPTDTERLDHLIHTGRWVSGCEDSYSLMECDGSGPPLPSGETPRAAIDAAMARGGEDG